MQSLSCSFLSLLHSFSLSPLSSSPFHLLFFGFHVTADHLSLQQPARDCLRHSHLRVSVLVHAVVHPIRKRYGQTDFWYLESIFCNLVFVLPTTLCYGERRSIKQRCLHGRIIFCSPSPRSTIGYFSSSLQSPHNSPPNSKQWHHRSSARLSTFRLPLSFARLEFLLRED